MIADSDVVAIAQRYSIPPAVLEGIVKAQGSSPTFNVPAATLAAYGLSLRDVQQDALLGLEAVARQAQQEFQQYGAWEPALSALFAGDPQAYSSPTSALGGIVYSVLGAAAADPTFGLSGYQPANLQTFQRGADGLSQHMTSLAQSGGVVRPESQAAFTSAVGQVAFQSDATLQKMATDVLAQMSQMSGQQYPATPANLALIATMARGEGMPAQDNNWLASTQGQGTGTVPGTPGVQIYGSYQQGIAETARTFLNGNYTALTSAMQKGTDLATMARDPDVQSNLRTWQGGSSEDVNNLLSLKDPGSSGTVGSITPALQAAAQNNGMAYTQGQCTAYAAAALGYIPKGLGDAESWASRAAGMGMSVNETPAPGTAVVYAPGGAYSPQYGHVAVVESVNPDGSFVVSEMNADGQGVVDQRVSTMQGVIGFIHPPAGTDMQTAAPWLNQQHTQATQQPQSGQQPGKQQQTRDVTPSDVAEFATQLKSAGIDPQTFTSLFPDFAAQQRMLTSDGPIAPVMVDEFIQAAAEIQQQGGTLNQAALSTWAAAQPHATYPNVSVGQVHSMRQMAALASIQHTQKLPTTAEAARFAAGGFTWKDVNAYYHAQREMATPTAAPAQAPPSQPQTAQASGGISDNAASARARQMERGA